MTSATDRPSIRIERHLAHPPDKVWRALTEAAHLSAWYPFPVYAIDPRTGGAITFRDETGTLYTGTITEFDPPNTFAFTEERDHLNLHIAPAPTGCLLTFTHTFDDPRATEAQTAGWNRCLDTLDAHLTANTAV